MKDIDEAGEPQVWGRCDMCENPIYYGEEYFHMNGTTLCLDNGCAQEWLENHCHTAED